MASNYCFQSSYADLPMEIILHILEYLQSSSDLCAASLTCRRWFIAAQNTKYAKNIYINIYKKDSLLHTTYPPISNFMQCLRNYTKIVFNDVDINQLTTPFWQYLGSTINEISFKNCDLTEKKFLNILKDFHHLQKLEIENCRELFMSGCLMEKESDRNYLTNAFVNVETLLLVHNRYMTDSLLHQFDQLMPKLCEISLAGCDISFHNGIYRKFYGKSGTDGDDEIITQIQPSKCVLTFQFISQLLQTRAKLLKKLNFSTTLIDGNALNIMAKLNDLKLSSLKLNGCHQLTNNEIINFIRTQHQSLTELELTFTVRLTDQTLINIAKVLPQLNVLKIGRCGAVTDIGIQAIATMKQLTILDISGCKLLTSDCVTHGIAQCKNEKIHELHVSALNICEIAIMHIAKNLPNLRVLDLSYCKNGVTDVAIQFIFKYLPWLRTLNLAHCDLISDFGITGVDMDHQMKQIEYPSENTSSTSNANAVQQQQPIQPDPARLNNPYAPPFIRISLGTRAEQEIVIDSKRKQYMFDSYDSTNTTNLSASNASGYSINNLKGLHKLDLTACTEISNNSLKHAFKLFELNELHLSACQQISIVGIEYLIENCPSLEYCDFSKCQNINDKSIELLTKKLNRLTHLYLTNCYELTDYSIDSIAINCKVLKYLDVSGCKLITIDPNIKLQHLTSLHEIKYTQSNDCKLIRDERTFRLTGKMF